MQTRIVGQGETDGPTLGQLQEAASELGLDPMLVEAAAREVTAPGRAGFWVRMLGGPWSAEADHVVEGMVTASDWPLLLDEIRAASGRMGDPKMVGDALEWHSLSPDIIHLTATPSGGRTRVRLSAQFGAWGPALMVLPCFGGLLLGGIASGMVMEGIRGVPVGVGLSLLFGPPLVAVAAGRMAFGRLCARRRHAAGAITSAVLGWFSRRASEPRASSTSAAPERLEGEDVPASRELRIV
jgi:hypothetical protein